jgi:xylan 1,4-beta-xylosidase
MRFDNPILRGFHPDPCLCRKENDFYLAVSTFEYYPGVKIYHSINLSDWTYLVSPLINSIVDLSDVPSSGGIWAPDLSYKESEEMFYLTYTVVTYFEKYSPYQGFKDTHNYFIKAKNLQGPWSTPSYICSWGFDPSLFHDEDGKSYFMSMKWNYRARSNNFDGIVLQEYDTRKSMLVGSLKTVTTGTHLRVTEGPHIYRVGTYYYLFLAEGGTSYNHSVSVLRSKSVFGPYEQHPETPFLSQAIDRKKISEKKDNPLLHCKEGLQKVGHASIARIEGNRYLMAFLCSRPDRPTAYCPLGRETSLTTITFQEDGWPHLDEDTAANLIPSRSRTFVFYDDFNGERLRPEWNFLRRYFLKTRNECFRDSHLIIEGGESPASIHQHFLGIAIPEYRWEASTKITFHPDDYQQMAGLVVRYNETNQYELAVSKNELGEPVLIVVSCIAKSYDIVAEERITSTTINLKLCCDGKQIYYFYSYDNVRWSKISASSDFLLLSDDAIQPIGFTGAFCGVMVNDMSGKRKEAAFDYFSFSTIDD